MNIKFFFVLAFDHLFLISFFFFLLFRTFADLQTLINQFVQLFFFLQKTNNVFACVLHWFVCDLDFRMLCENLWAWNFFFFILIMFRFYIEWTFLDFAYIILSNHSNVVNNYFAITVTNGKTSRGFVICYLFIINDTYFFKLHNPQFLFTSFRFDR